MAKEKNRRKRGKKERRKNVKRELSIPEKSDLTLTMRHSMIHRHTFVGLV